MFDNMYMSPDEKAVVDWLKEHKFPTIADVTDEQADEFSALWEKATQGDVKKADALYWLCEFAK